MKRWNEEVILVGYEMEWTVRYFLHQAEVWKHRGTIVAIDVTSQAGRRAYAARKSAMWQGLALVANDKYIKVQPLFRLKSLV